MSHPLIDTEIIDLLDFLQYEQSEDGPTIQFTNGTFTIDINDQWVSIKERGFTIAYLSYEKANGEALTFLFISTGVLTTNNIRSLKNLFNVHNDRSKSRKSAVHISTQSLFGGSYILAKHS